MAKQRDVTVCRLPPYHCELNPVELVWSQIKRHVAVHNSQFMASFVNNLIDNLFVAVSDNHWVYYCKHVEHIEQEMWMADNLQDDWTVDSATRRFLLQQFHYLQLFEFWRFTGKRRHDRCSTSILGRYICTLFSVAHSKVRRGNNIKRAILVT
jgi:hypothetical protein